MYNKRSSRLKKRKRLTSRQKRSLRSSIARNSIKKEKIKKILWSSMSVLAVIGFIGVIVFLFLLQRFTNSLPDIGDPTQQLASSIIYDKNKKELYRVSSSQFSRDLIGQEEYVPEALKWAFLAAEDEEFYEHPGVDLTAIARCGLYKLVGGPTCGGSTITQQTILNTVISRNDGRYIRKIKDILLALQLERKYDKDQIMNIYLNVVAQGGGIVGVKTGADFYFNKDIDELTVAEMTVLSAIVQGPARRSPTLGTDPDANKIRLQARTDYILDQMIDNLDRINERIDKANELNKEKHGENYIEQAHLTKEELEASKEEVRNLEYEKPRFDIKAPHFVFFVQKLLTERGYNNGEPFTESEIQTGGYKFYTTLDYDLQQIAEEYVSSSEANHAGALRARYGGHNSALMTAEPSTGDILTMVGSKCYQSNEYIPNCEELDVEEGGLFDAEVNVLDTRQSPGSTNKAIGYYLGFREGIVSTGSTLPDVPIKSIPGYNPKNFNGKFSGMVDLRYAFAQSLNIPALFVLEAYGAQTYVDVAINEFGYNTYTNKNGYGPSVVLGGADVKPWEHARAFSVFANGGDYVEFEPIQKIVDKDGNIVFEKTVERIPSADPAAVYLVNNVLNPRVSGDIAPTKHMRDRDVAGKTGTSQNNADTWFVMWSPDFVTLGINLNNDNTPMNSQAFGSTSVEPWVGSYMDAIAGAFPEKTKFSRPAGIVTGGSICPEDNPDCTTTETGLAIEGRFPIQYLQEQPFTVCVDQPNRLARPVDIVSGFAIEANFRSLRSPAPHLQPDVDAYFAQKSVADGGFPVEECDIDRNFSSDRPEGIIFSPQPGITYSDSLDINARAFSLKEGVDISRIEFKIKGRTVASAQGAEFSGAADISSLGQGETTLTMSILASDGSENTKSVSIYLGDSRTGIGSLSVNASSEVANGSSVPVSSTYSGSRRIGEVSLYQTSKSTGITTYVGTMRNTGSNTFEYNWVAPYPGEFTLYAAGEVDSRYSLNSGSTGIKVSGSAPEGDASGEEAPAEESAPEEASETTAE